MLYVGYWKWSSKFQVPSPKTQLSSPQASSSESLEPKVETEPAPESIRQVAEPISPMVKPSSNGKKDTPSLVRRKEEKKEAEPTIYDKAMIHCRSDLD